MDFLNEGRYESSGRFTIDLHKAGQQLAKYQLADPSWYVLKWVQAAVRLGCREVRVSTGTGGLELRGVAPSKDLALEALKGDLAALVMAPGESALKDLAIGLLAVLPRCQGVWAAAGDLRVEWTGQEAFPPESSQDLVLHVTTRPWADEETLLRQRCRYAPVPVLFQGKPVNAIEWQNPALPDLRVSYKFLLQCSLSLLERYIPDRSLPLEEGVAACQSTFCAVENDQVMPQPIVYTGCVLHRVIPRGGPMLTLPGRRPRATPICRTVLAVSGFLEGPSLVTFVRAGVCMNDVSVDLGCPGCFCISSGQGLSVDLSQFEVVRDAAFEAAVAGLRREVLDSIPAIRWAIPHAVPPNESPLACGLSISAGLAAMVLVGPVSFLMILPAVLKHEGRRNQWTKLLSTIDQRLAQIQAEQQPG